MRMVIGVVTVTGAVPTTMAAGITGLTVAVFIAATIMDIMVTMALAFGLALDGAIQALGFT